MSQILKVKKTMKRKDGNAKATVVSSNSIHSNAKLTIRKKSRKIVKKA